MSKISGPLLLKWLKITKLNLSQYPGHMKCLCQVNDKKNKTMIWHIMTLLIILQMRRVKILCRNSIVMFKMRHHLLHLTLIIKYIGIILYLNGIQGIILQLRSPPFYYMILPYVVL